MANYDFQQLSPHDFERMTRDLLQAEWKVRFESFKVGKDGGIDLRYLLKSTRTVFQCKHFVRTGISGLMRELAKEAAKVRELNVERYVLVTSVPLSPANKDKIVEIIGADHLHLSDVLGQDDLNNLLGRHPNIEGQHYKLWLASRAVLDRVLNNAGMTQSEFKVRQVYADIRRYVQSDAFPRALAMLKSDRVVVLAGPPGVGKTTLANMLLYEHLEKGYQAVVMQRDLAEGLRRFQEGVRQVFYFDDFMGATFFGEGGSPLDQNGDRAILDFMAMVRESSKARLVLTTREHILSQALERSERMRHSGIAEHRVVLRMGDYSFGQKGQILYNHLYFSDLPAEYQDELLRNEFYFEIIKHDKFNPRLIEWLSTFRRVKNVKAGGYQAFVRNLLHDPSEIWRHAYERELSDAGRSLLLALFSLRGKAVAGSLQAAFIALHRVRAEHYKFQRRPEDFRTAFRELAGSFIKPVSFHAVEVLDPSVLDLLNAVVREAPENAVDLILGACSFDQIAPVWQFAEAERSENVISRLAQETERWVERISPRLTERRRIETSKGNVAYRGVTFEQRLAVLVAMADRLRDASLLKLAELAAQRLFEEWQTETAEINNGVEVLRAFDRATWEPLCSMEDVRDRIRSKLVDQAAAGCRSDELRELLSVIDFDADEGGETRWILRTAYQEYQRAYFREELSECRSAEQFEELLEDLALFNETLGVDTKREVELTEERRIEFEQDRDIGDAYREDEWKERRYQERTSEESVREMFGSLASDRN